MNANEKRHKKNNKMQTQDTKEDNNKVMKNGQEKPQKQLGILQQPHQKVMKLWQLIMALEMSKKTEEAAHH